MKTLKLTGIFLALAAVALAQLGPPNYVTGGAGGGSGGTTYTGSQSITLTGTNFTLTGDTASPGNLYFYGTNSGGTRGWLAQSSITAGLSGGTNTQVLYFTGATTYGSNSGFTSDTSGNVAVNSLGVNVAASGTAGTISVKNAAMSDTLLIGGLTGSITNNGAISFNGSLSSTAGQYICGGATSVMYFNVASGGSYAWQVNGSLYFRVTTTSFGPYTDNTVSLGSAAVRVQQGFFTPSGITIANGTSGGATITTTGASGSEVVVISAPGSGITLPTITMGSGTGTVTAASGVFSVTSDKRAKNPHGDFTAGLDAILQLHPVTYDFKSDKAHLQRAGFYTQDVEGIIPDAVFHDSPDGMGSLDDRPILAAAVNAIKELASRPGTVEIRFFELLALAAFVLGARANIRKK